MMCVRASTPLSPSPARSAVCRAVGFSCLWLILSGADPGGLPAGAVAVVAATWTSLRLLPAGGWRASPVAIGHLAARFLLQSAVAGADVAVRALDPRLPLRQGFVSYPVELTPGAARNTFCTLSSLLPGTLPAGSDERGNLLVHCLDTEESVVAGLRDEEALLIRALGGAPGHG